MSWYRRILRVVRRALLGACAVGFILSMLGLFVVGRETTVAFGGGRHFLSRDGTLTFQDVGRTDGERSMGPWRVEFRSNADDDSRMAWRFFRWETLGFGYERRTYPAASLRVSATNPAMLTVPPYRGTVITVPYWALMLLFGAPEMLLIFARFRTRTLKNLRPPQRIEGSTLVVDLPCVHCAYNLRTQSTVGVCPECGLPIQDTLSLNADLSCSRPGWLRWLAVGNALLVAVRIMLALVFVALYSRERRLAAIAAVVGAVFYAFGIWCLTRREHPFLRPTYNERPGLRRVLAFILLICIAGGVFYQSHYRFAFGDRRWFLIDWSGSSFYLDDAITLWVAGWLLFCLSTVVEYHFLARLAPRLLDRFMTEHCRIAGFGAGLTGLVIPFWISRIVRTNWIRSTSDIWMLLGVMVCWLLFVIWTGFMNMYCAVRFLQQSWLAAESQRQRQLQAKPGPAVPSVAV
jgi:hypothetical protein